MYVLMSRRSLTPDGRVYCFLCGGTHALDEVNEEHIVPYALGNRKAVIDVGKACNTRANETFDNAFVGLDDITLGRARHGHGDRGKRVPKPAIEGREHRGGFETLHRVDVRGGRIVGNRVDRAQRQYGSGPIAYYSTEPLTREKLEEAVAQVDKLVRRSCRPSGIVTGAGLLRLPPPGMFEEAQARVEVQHDTRIRAQEALKILLGQLALALGPDLERLSFVQPVRRLLDVRDDEVFRVALAGAAPGVAVALSHQRPYAVPRDDGTHDLIKLDDFHSVAALGPSAEALLPPEDKAATGHQFTLALEDLNFQRHDKTQWWQPYLVHRGRFYEAGRTLVLCRLTEADRALLAGHGLPSLVVPFKKARV